MVMKCMFCGEKAQKGIRTLHTFPKCPKQRKCWVKNINLVNFVPRRNMRLCSNHFEKRCFQENTNYVKLKPGAKPTLFSTYKSACVYCKVHKNRNSRDRSFHMFPLQNKALLSEWLMRMGMEGFIPSRRSILCSAHFEKSCFLRRGNIRLKSDAVPTIFISEESKEKASTSTSTVIEEVVQLMPTTPNNIEVSVTEDTSDDTQNSVYESAEGYSNASISNALQHDHRYELTPRCSKMNLTKMHKRLKIMQTNVKNYNMKINRLRKKVTTLKDIVNTLRETKALLESEL